MRALPSDIEVGAVVAALAEGWGFEVAAADYAAVGAGSYHWVARGLDGTRRFVTVDDLDQKKWLGDTRNSACTALGRAFDTAVALRTAGLDFVVAPIRTGSGETLRRLGTRHTIALFPFVDGHAGRFGRYEDGARTAVVSMLAELHGATDAVRSTPRRIGLDLASRRHLEAGLEELSEPWSGGPFSEPARQVFAGLASDVVAFLSVADRLAAEVDKRGSTWVITHGEPHAANVMLTGAGHVLVDWDTTALAPRERDLWMLMEDDAEDLLAYTDATGHGIDQGAVSYFRLAWDLNDVAECLHELRSPHRESADTRAAFQGLTNCMPSRERWSELLD